MMDLGFLKDVKLAAVKTAAPKAKISVPKLPVEADLRVFGSGRVYPSKAFAEEYNLEFQPKIPATPKDGEEASTECTVVVGNGLDVFSSEKWGMIMGKLPQALVFVAAVPKSSAKVDMWASTKYDAETNQPKASVFLQGASTFSKDTLVPMLAGVYGIDWDAVEYVDFTVSRENVVASADGIYHLPKIVSTGKHKGEDTYVRRENLTICPLVVTHTEHKEVAEKEAKSNLDEALAQGSDKPDPVVNASSDENWADKLGDPTLGKPIETAAE